MDNDSPIHRIVFSHHPWFLNTYDEESRYIEGIYDEAYFMLPKVRRLEYLHPMKEANVSVCFCGHYHRNAIAFFGEMPVITTSAIGKQLGRDLSGFRIVKVFVDRIEHAYVSFDNIPNHVSLSSNE